MFREIDTNSDGEISRDELRAYLARAGYQAGQVGDPSSSIIVHTLPSSIVQHLPSPSITFHTLRAPIVPISLH
jgi:Ca2+-binding EF-hand superfamily protein